MSHVLVDELRQPSVSANNEATTQEKCRKTQAMEYASQAWKKAHFKALVTISARQFAPYHYKLKNELLSAIH